MMWARDAPLRGGGGGCRNPRWGTLGKWVPQVGYQPRDTTAPAWFGRYIHLTGEGDSQEGLAREKSELEKKVVALSRVGIPLCLATWARWGAALGPVVYPSIQS